MMMHNLIGILDFFANPLLGDLIQNLASTKPGCQLMTRLIAGGAKRFGWHGKPFFCDVHQLFGGSCKISHWVAHICVCVTGEFVHFTDSLMLCHGVKRYLERSSKKWGYTPWSFFIPALFSWVEDGHEPRPTTIPNIMKATHLAQTVILLSMAALHSTLFAETTPAAKTEMAKAATVQSGSLTTVIADSATFSTLTKAIKATGLDTTLGGTKQFTIFAPTDAAFGTLPEGTLTKLMLPENKEKLRMLLLYHVVAGKVFAADLKDGDVKTVNGETLKIEVSGDKIEVNDEKVYSTDVSTTSGVMHSIGKVLVPKSLDGFVDLKD